MYKFNKRYIDLLNKTTFNPLWIDIDEDMRIPFKNVFFSLEITKQAKYVTDVKLIDYDLNYEITLKLATDCIEKA